MKLKVEIDYNQLLSIIHQLPKKEIEQLTHRLQQELNSPKASKSLQELILKAPTWNDVDYKKYAEARDHLNKSRIA